MSYLPIYINKIKFHKRYRNIHNNIIISFSDYNEDVYKIEYDRKLYQRYINLLRVTNNDNLKSLIDLIDYCISIQISQEELLTSVLSNELKNEINKEILKKVISLGNGSNIQI